MLVACSCGGGTPVAPATAARVAGVWVGHSTLTSASGGECAGDLLGEKIGGRDLFAAHVIQSGNSLDAGVTYEGNAMSCEFSGGVQGTSLDLTLTSCRSGRVRTLQCKSGALRELELLSRRHCRPRQQRNWKRYRHVHIQREGAGLGGTGRHALADGVVHVERARFAVERFSRLRWLGPSRLCGRDDRHSRRDGALLRGVRLVLTAAVEVQDRSHRAAPIRYVTAGCAVTGLEVVGNVDPSCVTHAQWTTRRWR